MEAWRRRLGRLREIPRVDDHGNKAPAWEEAERASGDWPQCAIGERYEDLIERGFSFGENQYPADEVLEFLGLRFYDHVCHGDVDGALAVLNEIDARRFGQR